MSIFEAGMLICFGASWPFSVRKTYMTKNVKGKSKLFLSLVIIGYMLGFVNKLVYNFDAVAYLYLINASFVLADLILCFRYKTN